MQTFVTTRERQGFGAGLACTRLPDPKRADPAADPKRAVMIFGVLHLWAAARTEYTGGNSPLIIPFNPTSHTCLHMHATVPVSEHHNCCKYLPYKLRSLPLLSALPLPHLQPMNLHIPRQGNPPLIKRGCLHVHEADTRCHWCGH